MENILSEINNILKQKVTNSKESSYDITNSRKNPEKISITVTHGKMS
jgi:hypothetical protein